jgi:hypothetical protein
MTARRVRFALAMLVMISPTAWGQGVLRLAGTWILDPTTAGLRHVPTGVVVVGPYPSTLMIDVSASRVIIHKGSTILNREAYRLDGSETDVGGGRKGSAAIADDTLVLTIRRTRPDAGTNVFKEIYRVSAMVLTIERQLSVIQPDGTVRENISSYRHSVVYRRN